jgi:hypothetical protein
MRAAACTLGKDDFICDTGTRELVKRGAGAIVRLGGIQQSARLKVSESDRLSEMYVTVSAWEDDRGI